VYGDKGAICMCYICTQFLNTRINARRQTARFEEAGCAVRALELVDVAPGKEQLTSSVAAADVIVVSGGNTLFAVDRWVRLGVDALLRDAMRRGAVLAGGSAGAICWFDGGHSDSGDPDSYKAKMLAAAAAQGLCRTVCLIPHAARTAVPTFLSAPGHRQAADMERA
jgi:dipeptidase E